MGRSRRSITEDDLALVEQATHQYPDRSRSLSPPMGGLEYGRQLAYVSGPGPLPEGTPIIVQPAQPQYYPPPPPQLYLPMGSPRYGPSPFYPHSPPHPPHLLAPMYRPTSSPRTGVHVDNDVPEAFIRRPDEDTKSLHDELAEAEGSVALPEDPSSSGRRRKVRGKLTGLFPKGKAKASKDVEGGVEGSGHSYVTIAEVEVPATFASVFCPCCRSRPEPEDTQPLFAKDRKDYGAAF